MRIHNTRKDLLEQQRNRDQENHGDDHGHGPEGEQLLAVLLAVHGVLDERGQPYQLLAPCQTEEHARDVGGQRAVGVAQGFEVDHYQQLGEEDHVYQVGAHGPGKRRRKSKEGDEL